MTLGSFWPRSVTGLSSRRRRDGRDASPDALGLGAELDSWPTDRMFTPAAIRRTMELWFSLPAWMWRRTEHVRFIDLTTVERTITFDFELPPYEDLVGWVGTSSDLALVPLSVLQRHRAHPNQRLVDAAGCRMPFLTARENTRLVMAMLRDLDDDNIFSNNDLKTIVDGDRSESSKLVIERLHRHCATEPLTEDVARHDVPALDDRRARRVLLKTLVGDLAETYLFVAVVPVSYARQMLRLSFDERVKQVARRSVRPVPSEAALARIAGPCMDCKRATYFDDCQRRDGLDPNVRGLFPSRRRPLKALRSICTLRSEGRHIFWVLRGLADGPTTHIEIEVPTDLEIVRARVSLRTRSSAGAPPIPSTKAEIGEDSMWWRTFPAVDVGGRAHLHLRAGPLLPSDRWARGHAALVSVVLRPRARMLATAGAFVAWLALALLLTLKLFLSTAVHEVQAIVPLLVFVPSLIAALLAAPFRSEIANSLFALVRLSIALICVASTAAAAALVLNKPICESGSVQCNISSEVSWIWWGAITVVGLGAAIPLTVAGWHFSRAPKPEKPTKVDDREDRLPGARDLFAPWRRIQIGDGARSLPGGRAASHIDDLRTLAGKGLIPTVGLRSRLRRPRG